MISSLIMPEVFIQGGEGKLQAKYSPSEQEKPNIAIILHPNPKHGGTMDTKVNYAAFKVMKDAGFSTLRINFRGVGKSDGAFTGCALVCSSGQSGHRKCFTPSISFGSALAPFKM